MQVRATQPGFFGFLREAGDIFDVDEAAFSPRWMEKVAAAPSVADDPKPAKAGKKPD